MNRLQRDFLGWDDLNEHPHDTAWYALTGPQRRLVKAFMGDLERGVDIMDRMGMTPVSKPDAEYLIMTYQAAPEDAQAVADWCTRARQEDAAEDRVRGILDAWKGEQRGR